MIKTDEDYLIDNSLWDYTVSPPQVHKHFVKVWGMPTDLPEGAFELIVNGEHIIGSFFEVHYIRWCSVERRVAMDGDISIRKLP